MKGREIFLIESDGSEDDLLVEFVVLYKKSRKDDQKVSGKKIKFEEFLEMEMKGVLVEEDLEMERRLVKRLKVKGKLKDDDDGFNFLFEGILFIFDSFDKGYNKNFDSEIENIESFDDKKSKRKRKKKSK